MDRAGLLGQSFEQPLRNQRWLPQIVLPDPDNSPAASAECAVDCTIAPAVGSKLEFERSFLFCHFERHPQREKSRTRIRLGKGKKVRQRSETQRKNPGLLATLGMTKWKTRA